MSALQSIRRRLRSYDRFLDLEFRKDHWAVVDTSSILDVISATEKGYIMDGDIRVPIEITRHKKKYEAILHLPRGASPGSRIFHELDYRRMARWARTQDYMHEIERQTELSERSQKNTEENIYETCGKEMAWCRKAAESVTIDGNKNDNIKS